MKERAFPDRPVGIPRASNPFSCYRLTKNTWFVIQYVFLINEGEAA
jgi:hypothetical protein